MNFNFLRQCEIEEEWMRKAYAKMIGILEDAERVYWDNPQECGALLREAAEEICRIYDSYYKIGFRPDATLEEFLCYTKDEGHNAMVSRFLSVVRKEQRDRLIRLRVLGDDCIWGSEANERDSVFHDRMAQDAKRMMEAMVETLKTMCCKINGQEGLENLRFDETKLPERKKEEPEEEEGKASFFARLFKKREKNR